MAIAFGGADMAGYAVPGAGISTGTIAAWVRVPSTHTATVVQGVRNDDGKRIGIELSGANVKAVAAMGGGAGRRAVTTATFAPSSTVWHHILGTFDAGATPTDCEVYLDGTNNVAATGATLTGGIPSMVTLGCRRNTTGPVNSEFFTGDLAMVAFWSGKLSAANIARLAAGAHPMVTAAGSLQFYMDCIQLDANNDAVSIGFLNDTAVTPGTTAGTRTKVGANPAVRRPQRRSQWFRNSPITARYDRFFAAM